MNDLEMSRREHLSWLDKCEESAIKAQSAGRALKRIRRNAALTKKQLAEKLSEHPSNKGAGIVVVVEHVTNWEKGKSVIDHYWQVIISEVIGVGL